MGLAGKHEWSDVQGTAFTTRHPCHIHLDQLGQRLQEQAFIDGRHAHPLGALVEPSNVLHRAEQRNGPIRLTERLHAFKNRLTVVECH